MKSYSKKELARLYNVTTVTLDSWLRPFQSEIGEYRGRLYTPKQIAIIFSKLGEPLELAD